MTDAICSMLQTTQKQWGEPMTLPYLTDIEINDICSPLKRSNSQIRFLAGLGLLVREKPNGRPLVARNEFERAMINRPAQASANDESSQPDREAYLRLIKKEKNGTKTA